MAWKSKVTFDIIAKDSNDADIQSFGDVSGEGVELVITYIRNPEYLNCILMGILFGTINQKYGFAGNPFLLRLR